MVKIITIFVKSTKPLCKLFTSTSKTMAINLSTLTLQHFTQQANLKVCHAFSVRDLYYNHPKGGRYII